jgi:5-methylcytosine-specific restriction endonuclease McrA
VPLRRRRPRRDKPKRPEGYYAGCPIPKPGHGRADRNRRDGLPLAPDVRIVDEAVLNWARARGVCEVCGRIVKTEPLHIKTVGSGGSDTYANVAAGCRACHDATQDDGERGKEVLRAAVRRRRAYPDGRPQL